MVTTLMPASTIACPREHPIILVDRPVQVTVVERVDRKAIQIWTWFDPLVSDRTITRLACEKDSRLYPLVFKPLVGQSAPLSCPRARGTHHNCQNSAGQ